MSITVRINSMCKRNKEKIRGGKMSVLLAPSPLVELENLFTTEKRGSENGLYVSLETYWQQYYEHGELNYEWNNGRLEQKGAHQYITTKLYNWFLELLQHFLRVNQVGQIVNLETGFKLNLPTGQEKRKAEEAQNQVLLVRQEKERLIAKLRELGISLDEI